MRKIICFLLVAIVCLRPWDVAYQKKMNPLNVSKRHKSSATETPIQYPPHIESVWEEIFKRH
jgi:hypothetical protein